MIGNSNYEQPEFTDIQISNLPGAIEAKASNGKMKLDWFTDENEVTKAIFGKTDVSAFNDSKMCFSLFYLVPQIL